MPREIYARTAQKHDTEANWNKAVNFIPVDGEIIIYDSDAQHPYKRFKIGDGVTVAMNLPFTYVTKTELEEYINEAILGGEW